MDNVLLLKKHKIEVSYEVTKSHYNDLGDYIAEEVTETAEGVVLPFKFDEIKKYPEGVVVAGDLKFFSNKKITETSNKITVNFNDKKYQLFSLQEYNYIANLNIYVLREVREDV